MNEDFEDFLGALLSHRARFLVVGAHALAVHGVPRATGALDVCIERSPENAARVWAALGEFGAPLESLSISESDLREPSRVLQIGVRPRRIDLLTDLTGVEFHAAWEDRILGAVGSLEVPFLRRATLLENKRATGRLKDRADLESLGELEDS